jgi:hypothetical protein
MNRDRMSRLMCGVRAFMAMACVAAWAGGALAGQQVTNFDFADQVGFPAGPGAPLATGFTTGPAHAWRFESVRLPVVYNGLGFTNMTVTLRASVPPGIPGPIIETLATYPIGPGPDTIVMPSAGTILSPSTRYFVVVEASPSALEMRCTFDNGACSNTGWQIDAAALYFVPLVNDWAGAGNQSMRMDIAASAYFPPPIVTGVTGCLDTPPVTSLCPNSGGVQMVVTGANFLPDSVVLVGGIPAQNVQFVSPTQLVATLPPGAGRKQALTVVHAGGTAVLAGGVSYFAPACPGDANGDGVVNFSDVATVLSAFASACP